MRLNAAASQNGGAPLPRMDLVAVGRQRQLAQPFAHAADQVFTGACRCEVPEQGGPGGRTAQRSCSGRTFDGPASEAGHPAGLVGGNREPGGISHAQALGSEAREQKSAALANPLKGMDSTRYLRYRLDIEPQWKSRGSCSPPEPPEWSGAGAATWRSRRRRVRGNARGLSEGSPGAAKLQPVHRRRLGRPGVYCHPGDERWILPESDPLGRHPWYRAQPVDKQDAIGRGGRQRHQVGRSSSRSSSRRPDELLVLRCPTAPEYRYCMHEAVEEATTPAMFRRWSAASVPTCREYRGCCAGCPC